MKKFSHLCPEWGSNSRPWDYETHALPTAPSRRLIIICRPPLAKRASTFPLKNDRRFYIFWKARPRKIILCISLTSLETLQAVKMAYQSIDNGLYQMGKMWKIWEKDYEKKFAKFDPSEDWTLTTLRLWDSRAAYSAAYLLWKPNQLCVISVTDRGFPF